MGLEFEEDAVRDSDHSDSISCAQSPFAGLSSALIQVLAVMNWKARMASAAMKPTTASPVERTSLPSSSSSSSTLNVASWEAAGPAVPSGWVGAASCTVAFGRAMVGPGGGAPMPPVASGTVARPIGAEEVANLMVGAGAGAAGAPPAVRRGIVGAGAGEGLGGFGGGGAFGGAELFGRGFAFAGAAFLGRTFKIEVGNGGGGDGGGSDDVLILGHAHADGFGDAELLHGDAVDDVGAVHRTLVVSDDDELAVGDEFVQHLEEAAGVGFFERGVEFVEQWTDPETGEIHNLTDMRTYRAAARKKEVATC